MGGGGGKNKKGGIGGFLEDIGDRVLTTTGDVEESILGTNITSGTVKETKKGYDELTGENARKKEAAEKEAIKKAKEAQKKVRKKKAAAKKLGEARESASDERADAAGRQGRRSKTGRRSTILTDTLGGVGGEDNTKGKKSLLGY